MTTKLDLLRDILTDALIDLDFSFDDSEGPDSWSDREIEDNRNEVIEDMLSAIENRDRQASNSDFTVKVVMEKPNKYSGLEVFPGIKESLEKLTIRTK